VVVVVVVVMIIMIMMILASVNVELFPRLIPRPLFASDVPTNETYNFSH
jgi:hypothetical protein